MADYSQYFPEGGGQTAAAPTGGDYSQYFPQDRPTSGAVKATFTPGPEGFRQSVREAIAADPFPTAAKLVAGAGTAWDNGALALKQMFQGLTPEEQNRVLANREIATGAGMAGNIAGNVAMFGAPIAGATRGIAPLLATKVGQVAAPAVAAGLVNAAAVPLTNPTMGDETKAGQAAAGFSGGVIGDVGGRMLTRAIQPIMQTAPVRKLLGEGIVPTPGQAAGGMLERTEERLASTPLLGDVIKAGRERTTKELNRAVANRALSPIGERSTAALGRDAVEEVQNKLSQAYNNLLPNLSFKADQQFATGLTNVRNMAATLPPEQSARFEKVLREQVVGKLTPTGNASGETIKQIESELSTLARGLRGDSHFDNRQLAGAINEVRSLITQTLERSNPQQAAQLKAINEGYANYARLRDAASRVGADMGVFTPAQFQSAVRSGDKSVGKGRFAKGQAFGQDLSDPAYSVLRERVGDSGTAGRGLWSYFLTSPAQAVPAMAAGIAASPLYSRTGSRFLLGDLPMQGGLADLLRQNQPVFGQVGGLSGYLAERQ